MKTFQSVAHARLDQNHYHLLQLFYHMACRSSLLSIDYSKKKARFKAGPCLQDYRSLNSTEKYFALLESLWVRVNYEETFGHEDLHFGSHDKIIKGLAGLKSSLNYTVAQFSDKSKTIGYHSTPFLMALSFFGLLDSVELNLKKDPNRYTDLLTSFSVSQFGLDLFKLLIKNRTLKLWNVPGRQDFGSCEYTGQELDKTGNEISKPEPFIKAFIPLLKDKSLARNLAKPQYETWDMAYIFEVTQEKCSRTLKLSATHTYYALHYFIQQAFDFDDD
ncbi:MAG: hypothetical protein HRT88_23865, partial [Lentisphaeraceae bacterium]|nr:hypothetical protein [Lentisphaeraceae bacterium]